ncbi:MAG: creatininase [Gemmatimonadetes bacterium]|nr:MAG: creatininase [Gemmatimonadota bacterium]
MLEHIPGEHVRKSLLLSINILYASIASAQLSVHWEELTAADFKVAITRAQGTCLLPFGIMEKHGPHLPLGNDLLNVRYVALNAAQQEYAIVFPEYYFGQIFEAKHEPGTVAYSRPLQLQLLQETTDEMARNGCKKIIIVNGHGGNNSLLPYFAQTQLDTPHDYVVYTLGIMRSGQGEPKHKSNPATDMHAGESETSVSMIARPDLVHLDRAPQESGADQARLSALPEGLYTGIWWYARFPNHYAGEGAAASRELGEFEARTWITGVVRAIRAVKADAESLRLQNEFYDRSKHPLDTPQ